MNRFVEFLDNFIDQHTVNGATLFGVGLAMLALTDYVKTKAPNFTSIHIFGVLVYFIMAIHQFIWMGIIRKNKLKI